uniref:Uncharacterized protein n=1 Tax=Cacopsylla melanoneura TaxID=428564 RepID=A0A8D9BVM6_9HEMI
MMTPQTVSPGMKVTATTQSNSHRPTSDHTQSSLTLTSSHQSSQLHVPSTVVPLPPAPLEESSTVPLLPSCSDGDAATTTTTTHSSVPPLVASPAPLSPAVSSMGSPAPTSAPLSPAVPSSPVVKSKIPKRVVNSSSSSSTNTSPVHTLGSPARSCSSRTSDKASPSLLNGGVSPYASPSHELTPSSQRHYIKPIKPSLNNCSTPPHDISRLNTPTLTPTHQTTPSPLKPVESSLSEQRRNSFGFRSAEAKSNKSSNMNNSPNCEQTLKSSNKIVPGEKWASNASKSSPLKGLTRPAGEPVRKTQRSGLFSKPLNSSPSSIPCVQSKVESSGKVEKSSAVGTKPVPMECFGSPVAAQKPEKPTSLNLPVRTNTGGVHRKNSDVVRPHQMQKENLLSSPLKKVEQPSPLKKVATNMSTGGSNSSHSGPSTISSMSYVSKSSSDDVCESNTANLCSVETNKPHFKPFSSPVVEASDISSSTVHSKESQSTAQHTPSETNAPNKIFTQPHLKSPLTSATWNNKSVGKTTPLQSPNKTSGLAPLILESPSHSSVNKGPFATLMLGSPVKSPVCDHAAKDNNQSNATKDKLNRNTTSWSNGDSLTKDATAELSAKDVKDLSNSYAVAKEGSNGRPARPISFDLSLVTPPSLVSSLSPLTAAATLLINPLHPIPMSPTQSYIPISEPHQMTTSPIFPSTLPFLSKGSPQVTSLSPEVPLSPLKLTSPATSEVQSLLTSSPKHTTSKLASPVSGEVPSSPSHSIIASTTKPLDVLSPSNDSLKLTSPTPALVAEVLLSPTPNLITDSHLSPKDELTLTVITNGSSTPSKEQPASVITSPSKVRPLSFLPSPTKRTREVILPSKPAAVAPSLPSPTKYELSTEMISIARRTGSPVVSPVSTVSHIPTSPVASRVATVSPSATSPVASPVAAVSPCVTSPVASPVIHLFFSLFLYFSPLLYPLFLSLSFVLTFSYFINKVRAELFHFG